MTKNPLMKSWNNLLWGNSVALTWTWGLGLFFAVQVAIQFGFNDLIKFATIDAVGLTIFGLVNHQLIKKSQNPEEFENKFLTQAKSFKFALLFYQFVAITLTIYCLLKYITLPLGIFSFLVGMMLIGAVIFLGEEFPITRIKYLHAFYAVIMLTAALIILNSELFSSESMIKAALSSGSQGLKAELSLTPGLLGWFNDASQYPGLYQFKNGISEFAYWIPVLLGFLCGPWLDLQNWHRVVQINKEGGSVAKSYIIGGLIFWCVIMVDGSLALACHQFGQSHAGLITSLSTIDPSSLLYPVKDTITQVLSNYPDFNILLGSYMVFIGLAALATFDSGYIAYKWYTESLVKDAKGLIFTFIPSTLISSAIPWFTLCIVAAISTMHFTEFGKFIASFDPNLIQFFRFELEYYVAFFASFFLVYSVCFYRKMAKTEDSSSKFSALRLFSTALSSIAIFGIGYFTENTLLMAIAAILAFIYGWICEAKKSSNKAIPTEAKILSQNQNINIEEFRAQEIHYNSNDALPNGAKPVSIKGCYIHDNWFVHQFIPTYQDTNSVGNVYFAMYLMWVGKTRELFFAHVIPDFDPNKSDYLILTRSIDHKFQKEINEFTEVLIKIRIGEYNRKFVTLEHQIIETKTGDLVGKGKQALMFVSSQDYSLIDLPQEVQQGFIPYVGEVKEFAKG
ncbi:MAG: acyl-CoA thioesterase [Cyanobacteria bacterium]|nr:acyl-CoA thioesterase [Cyanobacteriota bacterium]MDA1021045.1 acyl-CoA thioesterase [Cyanobacteriota bacterium]